MTLEQAIAKWDIPQAEKILKQELKKRPKDVALWLKLSLTELQYPYEDYESALACLARIHTIDSGDLTARIVEAGIKWHSMGYIDAETFVRLNQVRSINDRERAILSYLESLYYQGEENLQKKALEKSIEEYDQYVYPLIDLGNILLSESKDQAGNAMLEKAAANVKKIWKPKEVYDFTDAKLYIAEFITGTVLSASNFEAFFV